MSSVTQTTTKNFKDIIEKIAVEGKLISEADVALLCDKAKELFYNEPNVLHLTSPITIVGEVHGYLFYNFPPFPFLLIIFFSFSHFDELLELFRVCGECPHTTFLFLGDYVNKGLFSVESITLLLSLKLCYPERIYLIRGNHDCFPLTQVFL
jgi:hypothetical protein